MFPITLSSIGDIIAVVQLLCDIRTALSETVGSHREVQDLSAELHTLEDLLRQVSKLVAGAADRDLQENVFQHVQCCGEFVNEMLDSLVEFSPLAHDAVSAVAVSERIHRGVLKLRWRFSKQADVRACRAKLKSCREELLVVLSMYVARYLNIRVLTSRT
jgi:hypothetical protein